MKNTTVLCLLLLITLGSYLRIYDLSSESYWMDEATTVIATKSILAGSVPSLYSGEYYHCPIYCYPTAVVVSVLGDTEFSYRILSAIFGVLFILIIFFSVRRIFNRNIALLSAIVVTFSYWQIAWSRQARWYTLFECFFWLAMVSFYHAYTGSGKRFHKTAIILTGVFTSLAILTHGLGFLLPFLFIVWIAYDEMFVKKTWNKKLLTYATLTGVVLLTISFALKNIGLQVPLNVSQLHYLLPYYLRFYISAYWLFVPFFIYSIFLKKGDHRYPITYITFFFAAYLLSLSFLTDTLGYRYMFHLTPVIYILGIYGMVEVYRHINIRWMKMAYIGIISILFFTIGGGTVLPKTEYLLESDTVENKVFTSVTPQPDWKAAYDVVRAEKKEKDIVISTMPAFTKIYLNEPGYWIAYQYLGKEDTYRYVQNGHERYVGALALEDLSSLKEIVEKRSGFIVFDANGLYSTASPQIFSYIKENLSLVFHKKDNDISEIWVYRF